ncbi:MAG: LPS-assembly protein LptD [Spirochaetales bacterium]|nr:LPS-assembly protein LptD [Spirochaetales bacterium]
MNRFYNKFFLLYIILLFSIATPIFSQDNSSELEQLKDTYVVDIDTASYNQLVAWCKALGIDYSGNISALRTRLKRHYEVTGAASSSSGSDQLEIKQADAINYYKIQEIEEDYIELVGNVEVVMTEDSTTHTISADVLIFNKKQNLLTAIGNVVYRKKLASGSEDVFVSQVMSFDIQNWTGTILKGVSRQEKKLDDEEGKEYSEVFYYSGDRIIKGEGENLVLENGLITSSNPENPYYSIKADKIWVLGPGEWAIKNAFLSVGEVPLIPLPFLLKWGDHLFFNPVFGEDSDKGMFIQTTTYLLGEKEEDPDNTFSFLDPSSGESDKKKKLDGFFLRPYDDEEETKEKKNSLLAQFEKNKAKIKFLFDFYSGKGFMFGFSGDLGKFDIDITPKPKEGESEEKSSNTKKKTLTISQLNFTAALAASMNSNSFFYYNDPLLFGDRVVYSPIWEKSFFLNPIAALIPNDDSTDSEAVQNLKNTNVELPFLYYFTINTKLSYEKFSTEINIDYIADRLIYSNFFEKRKENFDFKQIFGLSDESTTSDLSFKSTTEWYIKNSFSSNLITKEFFAYPYLSTFNLRSFSLIMNFDRSKIYTKSFTTYTEPNGAPAGTQTQSINYLMPKNFVIPIEFNLAGSIFDFEYGKNGFVNNLENLQPKKKSEGEEKEEEKKEPLRYTEENYMRLPWESQSSDEEDSSDENSDYIKLSDPIKDDQTKKTLLEKYFTQRLTWSLDNMVLRLQGNYNTDRWMTPQDIDFSLKDFQTIFSGNFSLKYDGDLGNGFFTYSNTVKLVGSYQHRIDLRDYEGNNSDGAEGSYTQAQLDAEKEQFFKDQLNDKKATKFDLTNNFTFTMKPFKFFPYVTDTLISYSIGATLIKFSFSEIQNKFIIESPINNELYEYDRSLFSTHRLSLKIPFTIKGLPQYYLNTDFFTFSLGLDSNLLFKSLKGDIKPSFSYDAGPVDQSFTFTFRKDLLNSSSTYDALIDDYELDRLQSWYLNDLSLSSNVELFNNYFCSFFIDDLDSKLLRDIVKVSNKIDYNFVTGKFSNIKTDLSFDFIDLKTFFPMEKSEYLLTLKQSVGFSNKELDTLYPDSANFEISLWKFSLRFDAVRDNDYIYNKDSFNFSRDTDSEKRLRSSKLTVKFKYDYVSPPFWEDRIRLGFGIDTSYSSDFLNILSSSLSFKFKFKFSLFNYLDVFIESWSQNNVPYLYTKSGADKVSELAEQPIEARGFFEDLFLSMSFDQNDRKRAYFKLMSIKLGFVHYFDDWNLNFVYVAEPYPEPGSDETKWSRSFAFYITWKGIKPIKSKISYQTTGDTDKKIYIE